MLSLYPSIRQPMAFQGSKGDIFAVWAGVRKIATFSTPVHTAKNVACARRVLSAVFSIKQPESGDESEGVSASSVGKQ